MITVKEKPMVFKARYIVGANGKRDIAVDPITETRKRLDGSSDVIVHMPTLDLINDFKAKMGV